MSACQSCGTALAADTRFCQSCGSPTELRPDVSISAIESPTGVAVVPPPGEAGPKTMDTNLVGALTYLARFLTGIIFSCPGSVQVELLRSLSRFPVDFLQCRLDRLLDCLDDSVGCANSFDGRNLWLDCFAADVGFRCLRLWNLDFPDGSGLSAKTLQAANRG